MTVEKQAKQRKPRMKTGVVPPEATPVSKIQGRSKADVGPVTKKPKPVVMSGMASRLTPPSYRQKVAASCGPGTMGGGGGGFGGGGGGGGITGNSGIGGTTGSAGGSFYSPELSTDFLQLPQSLNEQWNYYRFFYNNEPFVGQAIDIHTEIPLSKIRLARPVAKDPEMGAAALRFCEAWVQRIGLLRHLMGIVHEYHLIGEAFIFCEDGNPEMPREIREDLTIVELLTDEGVELQEKWTLRPDADVRASSWMKKNYKGWTSIRVLPPEQVHIETFQFTDAILIELIPDGKTKYLLDQAASGDLRAKSVADTIDPVVRKSIIAGENIPLNLDPDAGSFVYYMANKKSPYEPRGHSILQRCLLPGTLMTINRKGIVQEVPVEDVDVATDLLLTHKGRFRKAQKGSRPVREAVTVLEIEGVEEPLCVTSDHEVLVVREDGTEEWVEAGKLQEGDVLREAHVVPEQESIKEIDLQKWWEGRVLEVRVNRKGVRSRKHRVSSSSTADGNLCVSFEYTSDAVGRAKAREGLKKMVNWLTSLEAPMGLSQTAVGQLLGLTRLAVNNYTQDLRKYSGLRTEQQYQKGKRGGVAVWYPLHPGTPIPRDVKQHTQTSSVSRFKVDLDFCYLLGAWLGDGSVWRSTNLPLDAHSLSWCAGLKGLGPQILDRIRGCVHRCFGVGLSEGHLLASGVHEPSGGSAEFRVEDPLLARFFMEEFGFGCEGKHLPEWVFSLGREQILSLLQGLLDTDGCVLHRQVSKTKKEMRDPYHRAVGVRISLKNPILLNQIRLLCQRVGITSSMSWRVQQPSMLKSDQKGGSSSVQPIRSFPVLDAHRGGELQALLQGSVKGERFGDNEAVRQPAPSRFKDGWLTRKVRSVTFVPYKGPVYSFDVEEDHSHVTNGVVTHNCMRAIVHADLIRQASAMIVSRHMTPVRLIYSADNAMDVNDVEMLRDQIDQALQDPDFSIITNFQVTWEELPSNGRMLEVSGEMDLYLRQMYAGLGVTESLLSGESSYSGDRINLEIVNTRYMLLRELLQDLVYEYFLKPMCRRMGFVEEDEDGNMVVVCPRLSFTRLPIRDSQDIFEQLLQLYQKGSLPVSYIYDALNIDPVEAIEQLQKDAMTLRDANMNEALRSALSGAGQKLSDNSNLASKLAEDFGLDYKEPAEGGGRF